MRHRGFDYKQALRKLDPDRYRRLYPDPTRAVDIRNRLDRVQDKIEQIAWGHNALGAADRMSELVDERRRLRDALAKVGGKRPPARHVPTGKRRQSEGSRP